MLGAAIRWAWGAALDVLWVAVVGIVLYAVLAMLARQGLAPWAVPALANVRHALRIAWASR